MLFDLAYNFNYSGSVEVQPKYGNPTYLLTIAWFIHAGVWNMKMLSFKM